MKSLQEEREAIVEEFSSKFLLVGEVVTGFQSSDAKTYLRQALLSHEEKVTARVFGEIEQLKSEVVTMDYGDDFKDGIYATIEHILSMPSFESVLTLPITDEKV